MVWIPNGVILGSVVARANEVGALAEIDRIFAH